MYKLSSMVGTGMVVVGIRAAPPAVAYTSPIS